MSRAAWGAALCVIAAAISSSDVRAGSAGRQPRIGLVLESASVGVDLP